MKSLKLSGTKFCEWGRENGYDDLPDGVGKPGNDESGAYPVTYVNWYDCIKWCNARSEMENRAPCYTVGGEVYRVGEDDSVTCDFTASGYRLPTEVEWEYAARGGAANTRFPWGDEITHDDANYNSDIFYKYDVSPTRGYHPDYNDMIDPYTSPVGTFDPNVYGLYDVIGNAYEWCWEKYGGLIGADRVRRGGNWYYGAYHCRLGFRRGGDPGRRNYGDGFRVATSVDPDLIYVKFDLGDHGTRTGGGELLQAVPLGDTAVEPVFDIEDGWSFTDWDPPLEPVTEAVTYVAQWKLKDFTITFDTDGGSYIQPITQKYGTEVTAPADPTKTGHTFVEWDPAVPITMPAYDMTCTAQWDVNEYTITFNSNGGSTVDPITQDYDTDVTAPADPTREGYDFAGWEPEVPAKMPAEDTECVAQWKINQYTITFNSNGGSTVDPITQDYDTDVTAPADPTREGYDFAGWEPEVPAKMPAENMTCTAQWTINQYTITFNSNGGSTVDPITQDYDTDVTAPADPTREGYDFAGWEPEVPAKMPAENMTCTAQWTINQYTITFNSNGGSTVDPITQDYDTDVTAPADPTREGYDFAGWEPEVPAKMPAENMTCTAQWTINQYTITFNSNGGSTVDPITQDYDTDVTAPADPTREGYDFAGWEPAVPNPMPAEDTECVAQWKINQYTITFDVNGGDPMVPNTITADYDTDVTPPADPTRDGYNFTGWEPAVPATMPAENMTCVAQWNGQPKAEEDAYTVNGYSDTYTDTPTPTSLTVDEPGVLGNDTDPEDEALTAILVTDVANGTLTLNADGSFTYAPNLNFWGTDTFTYQANDGHGNSAPATVTITVLPPSDEFAPIPGGTKTGTNPLQLPREAHSNAEYPPEYNLTVDDYYIGKYEVSKKLWDTVRNWGLANGYTDLAEGKGKGDNHPVYSVSWYDCVKWCNARSEKEGHTPCYKIGDADGPVYRTGEVNNIYCDTSVASYRLPKEVEWEYAARGDAESTRYSWGNKIKHTDANYKSDVYYLYDISETRGYHPDYNDGVEAYTSPVESFAPNYYGIYDMMGNAYEWCFEVFHSSTTARVRRGGSWYEDAYSARIGFRRSYGAHLRNKDQGFRLAITAPAPLP